MGDGAIGMAGSLALGVVLLAIGVATLVIAGRPLFYGLASRGWPTATGTLQSFEIGAGGQLPALRMTYTYAVHGRHFTGARYRIAQLGPGASMVPGTPAEWRVGQPLAVRHHPRRPEIATIETGIHPWASIGEVFLVILAMGFLVSGCSLMLPLLGVGQR